MTDPRCNPYANKQEKIVPHIGFTMLAKERINFQPPAASGGLR
jgi:hypothetical protein